MSKRNRLIMGVSAIVASAPALASGFGFYENGAKASAQGGAWVARADDASANWYNPAALAHLTENWIGTWSYRLGLAFRLGNEMKHELRVGGVLDKTPIPVEFLRPSIPDSDRTGYSLGYGYLSTLWGIDVYAMHLQFDDVTINGSPSDAVINGTYTSSILLAGVTAEYRF